MSTDGSTQQIVLSKYILQWDYFVPYRLHKAYDARIRTFLEEPEKRNLKYPKSKDDYIGLVKLVADDSPDDFWGESTDVLMDRIRRKYIDGEHEVWEEFQAVLDKCLEYGRFRDIRLLGMLKSRALMLVAALTGIQESFGRTCLTFTRSTYPPKSKYKTSCLNERQL